MKLSDFKKDLEAVGVSFEEASSLFWDIKTRVSIEALTCDVLCHVKNRWSTSREGYEYWNKKFQELHNLNLVAKRGTVCDYPIEKSGNNWVIGCQIITPRQRLKLFKLLADDLDYELTEE